MTIAEQLREEGREQGREEGVHVGRVEVLSKLLQLRFGALSLEQEQVVSSATAEQIDRWVERVLVAETIDDVLLG